MAKKQLDITKVGPAGYRALQQQNNQDFDEVDSFISQSLGRIQAAGSQSNPYRDAPQKVKSPLAETSTPWGESIWDNQTANEEDFRHLSDVRANNQPWYSQLANGILKGTVLAGTTFANGTVGLLTGIGTAVGEQRFSGIWDNDFMKATNALTKASEEAIPNYYTEDELEHPFRNILSANFIGDKLLKNIGFSVGAFYSGRALTAGLSLSKLPQLIGAVSSSSKAPAIVSSSIGAITSAVNEGSVEAYNGTSEWFNQGKSSLDNTLRLNLKKLNDEYQANMGKNYIRVSNGEGTSLVDEAYLKYQEGVKREKQIYGESLKKLEEDRQKMGNAILLMNLPILTFSNLFQFGRLYSKGYDTAVKSIQREAGLQLPKALGRTKAIIGAPLSEGFEELSQNAATNIAGDYYTTDVNNFHKAKTDPRASLETLSAMKSLARGINETVNDSSAWEEFLIGALTGAMGMPQFRSPKSAEGNWQSPITFGGGIYNDLKEFNEEQAKREVEEASLNSALDYLNERAKTPEFKNYYQGLVRHNKYQNDMREAAESGDKVEYKNAEHSQLISDIMMFSKAGKLDDFYTYLESALDTSDENLEAIVKNTSTNENDKISGPFIDSDGNPMYSTPEGKQKMIEELQQRKDNILKTAQEYVTIKENLENLTKGTLTEDQLEELTWLSSQLNNWKERTVSMSGEIRNSISDLLGNLHSLLRVNEEVKTYEEQHSADLTERYKQADSSINTLKKNIKTLETARGLNDKDLAFVLTNDSNFTKGLIEEVKSLDESVYSETEKEEVISKLSDIIRLGEAMQVHNSKFEEYLRNPEKQSEDQEKATQENAEEELKQKTQKVREDLDKTTTLAEFREVLNKADNSEAVMEVLEKENDPRIKNLKEIDNYSNKVKSLIQESGADNIEDAISLFDYSTKQANSLEEAADIESELLNTNIFEGEETNGLDMSSLRFEDARFALQEAMKKVNEDKEFKDRFTKEAPKPGEKVEPNDDTKPKGDDREPTGNSETTTTPPVNTSTNSVTDNLPVGDTTFDTVLQDNKETNDKVEIPERPNKGAVYSYYRPAIPELHIEGSKEGDFRPFDVVVAERQQGVDFTRIYSYLRDNGAFDYLNEGKLKVGDRVKFMIDPSFNDHTIFIVDAKNNQIIGSLDESDYSVSRFAGLKALQERILKEYQENKDNSKDEEPKKFYATPESRVSKIMIGKIPYSHQERSLKEIPNVSSNPIFGIIKNGTLFTNDRISDSLIVKPYDMSRKEGRLYLLIPNGAGKYSPAAVRVKHFNHEEFNLDDLNNKQSLIGSDIYSAIKALSASTSPEEVKEAVQHLAQELHLQDVIITWEQSNNSNGILISRKVRKPDGSYVTFKYKDKEYIKETKKFIPVMTTNEKGEPDYRLDSDIYREILTHLYSLNLPIQVNARRLNKGNSYNERLINSDILTSNISSATTKSTWFTLDYFDESGNLQTATNPKNAPKVNSKPSGVIEGTPVTSIHSNKTYYVDLKTNTIKDEQGVTVPITPENAILLDLAWANANFGDKTTSSIMTNNKILLPNGQVLDRTSQKYLEGKEKEEVINYVKNIEEKDKAKKEKAEQIIAEIYANQDKVDKGKTDGEFYYIAEEDGEYHPYSRVHSVLGNNWLGDSSANSNSTRALEAGTAIDNVIRQFFTQEDTSTITKPVNLTDEAFNTLIKTLTEIKEALNARGERFLTNNIVLFKKYEDGRRIAGEVDILSVDKDNNFKIYDVKTSRWSFYDFKNRDGKTTNYFTSQSSKQRMSTKDYYTLQLSAYKNLFESQYDAPIERLAILPFVLSYNSNDEVTQIVKEKGIPIEYNASVAVPISKEAIKAPKENLNPIFDSTLELQEPISLLDANHEMDSKTDKVGYFEIKGKLYKGYLSPMKTINNTPLYLTKEVKLSKGFGNQEEHVALINYVVVFPNGRTITIIENASPTTTVEKAKTLIEAAISKNPNRLAEVSSEDTLLTSFTTNTTNQKTVVQEPILDNQTLDIDDSVTENSIASQQKDADFVTQKENAIKPTNSKFKRKLKLREQTTDNYELWDKDQEVSWLEGVLPQLSTEDRLQFTEGLIPVVEQGTKAFGSFDGHIITLSNIAAKGTLYHEAFHGVFNLLLNPIERNSLLNEYRKAHPSSDNHNLEELLAEDFREFVMQGGKDNRSLGTKILDFFKSLFIKTKYWKNFRPSSMYYFKAINEGKYAEKSPRISQRITTRLPKGYTFKQVSVEDLKNILTKGSLKNIKSTDSQVLIGIPLKNISRQSFNLNGSVDLDENTPLDNLVIYTKNERGQYISYDTSNLFNKTKYKKATKDIMSKVLDNYYTAANAEIRRLNYKTYNTVDEALRAFYNSGISKKLLYRITRFGANNAKEHKIQLLTRPQYEALKKSIIEREEDIEEITKETKKEQREKELPSLDFNSLDPDTQTIILNKGYSSEDYNSLSREEKEHIIECLAI